MIFTNDWGEFRCKVFIWSAANIRRVRYTPDEISPSRAKNSAEVGDEAIEEADAGDEEQWEDEDSSEGEIDYEIYSKIV